MGQTLGNVPQVFLHYGFGVMAENQKAGAARFSVLSNTTLVILKLVVGIMTGSVSIISEAAHSAVDLVAAILAYFSVRAADRPADEEHPFGHGKIENLSGTIEAALIFVAALYIVYEAVQKLRSHDPVKDLGWGIVLMAFSAALNFFISRWLYKVAKKTDSVALEADAQHLSVDVWTSVSVLVGLGLMWVTGWPILDPLIALAVAALIFKVSWDLTREAGAPLLDTRLPKSEHERIYEVLRSERRLVGFHKLRTRKAGGHRHVDVHLIVPESMNVTEAHALAEQVEDKIRNEFHDAHVVTHVEPGDDENLSEEGTVRPLPPEAFEDG